MIALSTLRKLELIIIIPSIGFNLLGFHHSITHAGLKSSLSHVQVLPRLHDKHECYYECDLRPRASSVLGRDIEQY